MTNEVRNQTWPELVEENQPVEGNVWLSEIMSLSNELLSLHRHLAKKNEILAQFNIQKDEFLGMAAYDLRNPLGIIMEYSEFLLCQGTNRLAAQQRQFVEIIHSASFYMLNLVESFLNLSVIETGKFDLHRQPTDMASLTQQNLELNQVLVSPQEINLHFQSAPNLPFIWIDQVKIEQVLNNLLSSAVKFSLPDSRIQVQVTLADGHVQTSIAYLGQGTPKAELDRLFQPSLHTGVWPTISESSAALGLAISRHIIEAHGGRIWATSNPGQGTTIFFSLPAISNSGTGTHK